MRNEGEHFRTGGKELDKFPQETGGSILRVRRAGRPHRAGSNQGRRWRADFFLLRARRARHGSTALRKSPTENRNTSLSG
jgi:hypothetical protein